MPNIYPVYVVDDDEGIRDLLCFLCADRDIACRTYATGEDFLSDLDTLTPGCVLLDMRLPRRSGLQVQTEMLARGRTFPVIAITGYADVDMAVESMRLGAIDFLEKPFGNAILFDALALAFARLAETDGPAPAAGEERNDTGPQRLNR